MSDIKKIRRLLIESGRPNECSCCGLSSIWNNKPLTLHVDHINGDRKNNDFSNLRFLCPNCHSQTDTYCGRNIKGNKRRASAKVFREFLEAMGHAELEKYLSDNTYEDLCKKHSITRQVIWKFLKSKGITKPTKYSTAKHSLRKVDNRPTKDELLKLVSSMPMTEVGKKFGVSDNAIRKWCRWEGILPDVFFLKKNRELIGKDLSSKT